MREALQESRFLSAARPGAKTRWFSISRLRSIPRLITLVTAVQMAVGLGVGVAWWSLGEPRIVETFFRYPGTLFLVGAAGAELWLSGVCWRQFLPGEPMRRAWFLIMLSAAAHLAGRLLSELLGGYSYLNPLLYSDAAWVDAVMKSLRETGLLIGGPLQMALLACGLAVVLRVERRSGLLPRLTRLDWLLIAALAAYTLGEAWEVAGLLRRGKVFTGYEIIAWTSDPLLIVLLFQAICIRRSVLAMGWGLIARCWGAFVDGIAFTALGDIWLWAGGYLPWPLPSLGWYIWFLAAAAFALGPAYQMEAFRRVHERAERAARSTAA